LRRRIEGMQVLSAGCFSRQRRQGEVRPQAVQDAQLIDRLRLIDPRKNPKLLSGL